MKATTITTAGFPQKMWIIIISLLVSSNAFAQDPNWSVNESDYEHTMTFLSFLTIDGNRLDNENDKVAVFVDGVCRGTTNLTYVASQDGYYAFLTAFANIAGETMTIRVYDSENDQVRNISTTFDFEISSHSGTLFQAVSWADPVLSSEAEILDFSFDGIAILDQSTQDRNISIILEDAVDVSSLTPVFELSNNADMFINTVLQESGQNQVDFTTPVNYQVRSQDQSTLNIWTVTVLQVANDLIYRKRNAICYEPGAIKVTSTQNGAQAILLEQGTVIDTKTIIDQEVLFEGLEAGFYDVQIGNIVKAIEINLITN